MLYNVAALTAFYLAHAALPCSGCCALNLVALEPTMDTGQPVPDPEHHAVDARRLSRLQLLVNLSIFQLKLLMDGIRDILLVPIALGCGLFGIVFGGDHPDRWFNQLLQFGQRSDRFINLFNQHNNSKTEDQLTSDEMLAPYREKLVNQAQNSPLATKANELVDQITDQSQPAVEPGRTSRGKDQR